VVLESNQQKRVAIVEVVVQVDGQTVVVAVVVEAAAEEEGDDE
jgi:hypothetical protein